MSINIPCRSIGIILLAALVTVTGYSAEFEAKIVFKKNIAVPFATFTLTYLGQRRVTTEKYARGFLLYDFRVTSARGTQTISWSAGTGVICPTRFRVGREGFAVELVHSDKLGWLKENEMVVGRSP